MSTFTSTNRPAPVTARPSGPPGSRASTAGYWVGALVAVAAILGALVWAAFALLGWRQHVEDFTRVTPPGTAVVSVTDTGTAYVYLEHDRSTVIPPVPAVIVEGPSGAEVPVADFRGVMRYDVPGEANRVGDAVLRFPADEPGTYRITVADTQAGATVAIGDHLVWAWAPQVVGMVALVGCGLLVGVGLVVVTAIRRSTS